MIIFIEQFIYYFYFNNIVLLESEFYYISSYKLKKLLIYSNILEIYNPDDISELIITVDEYFEMIDINVENADYYYGCLIKLLLCNWDNYKFTYLLTKYNDYIKHLDYKKIITDYHHTLIYFYYIVKNFKKIVLKDNKI